MRIISSLIVLLITGTTFAQLNEGARWQLLADHALIAKSKNIEQRVNPPVKREIVLVADKPWESDTSAYYSVVQNGPIVRLYYRGLVKDDHSDEQFTCCAESTDGIHFTRPNYGIIEFNGSKQNNIIFKGGESAAIGPFVDTNPAAKSDERYKALAYKVIGEQGAVMALSSPDGLHWKRMQESPVMGPGGGFDTMSVAFWDSSIKKYRAYTRYWSAGAWAGARAIQSSTSDDFVHWSKPTPNEYPPGTPPENLYTSATVLCPGAEHLLLSFPMRFIPDRAKVAGRADPGAADALIMSSRDGVHWGFRANWIEPDLDVRNWTDRNNMPAHGIVELGDEFSMYISENYRWPTNRLRRVTVPRHRFVSAHAGSVSGQFTTPMMVMTGKKLLLNYSTSAAGAIEVAVEDASGNVLLSSSTIFGNELAAPVAWKSDAAIQQIQGKPIRLRFTLREADLYAFQFRD